MKTLVLVLLGSLVLNGCSGSSAKKLTVSGGGSGGSGSSISYQSGSFTLTNGIPITTITPTISGATVTSWSVSPSFASTGLNLSFDTSTGAVSGTPAYGAQIPWNSTNYTVSAVTSSGTLTATLNVLVNEPAPPPLTYDPTAIVCVVNVSCGMIAPSAFTGTTYSQEGDAVFSAISLPTGLSISSVTGVISGTPTSMTTPTLYSFQVANHGGTSTSNVLIAVVSPAPTGLTYGGTMFIYTNGTVIGTLTPTVSGSPTSYSVAPSLPTGVNLNTSTGIISGTPTAVTAQGTYIVSALNSGGASSVSLTMTVNEAIPSLSGAGGPFTYTVGTAITAITPANSGGQVTSCMTSPTLPANLSIAISGSTCSITGTPSVGQATSTVYTIYAANSGGTGTENFTITSISPTESLTYLTSAPTYTKGTGIAANTATVSGIGAVTACSSSPSLPAGLSFTSATNCTLTGTPTASVYPAQAYAITATGSTATAGAVVTIQVNDSAPTGLGYSLQSATGGSAYSYNTTISTNTSTPTGGTPTSYTVGTALPTGLSLNAATGAITGTPTQVVTAQTYTVTGSNHWGTVNEILTITVNEQVVTNDIVQTDNSHSCGLVNGVLKCWGANGAGELGNNSTTNSLTPVAVTTTAGYFGTAVMGVATGAYHTCAIYHGNVFCWGDNTYGELGYSGAGSLTPVLVSGLGSVTSIVASGYSTCAINSSDDLYCWGLNFSTQTPTLVGGAIPQGSVSQVALNINQTCAVTTAGNVYCGTGTNNPTLISGISNALSVTVGAAFACVVTTANDVLCWGSNLYGQFGDGTTNSQVNPTPIAALTNVYALWAGDNHTCGRFLNAGVTTVQCWGSNASGQLGLNPLTNSYSVTPQTLYSGANASISVSAAGDTNCMNNSGIIQCIGDNTYGAFGNGGTTNTDTLQTATGY